MSITFEISRARIGAGKELTLSSEIARTGLEAFLSSMDEIMISTGFTRPKMLLINETRAI